MRKSIWRLVVAAMLVTTNLCIAQSDRYPAKPIQMILTSTPGTQSDVLMRFLGAEVSKSLGQPIVIVNKASAAGTIGTEQARKAPPDGYTLFLGGNTTMAANIHLIKNLTYDPVRDFEPITLVTANPLVLVVRSDLPIKSVADLIAYAKARPGEMNYGVGNSGNKVAVGQLQSLTGIKATDITFTGASQAMMELVAGRLDFMMSDPLVAEPFIKQGVVRALAVTSSVRPPSLSSLPTMVEASVPGYREVGSFLGIYAPRGVPKVVINTLHEAFVKAINSQEGQAQFQRLGLAAQTSTPQGLADFTREQIAVWEHLVNISGLQPQ